MPTVEKGGSAGAVDGPAELTHFERGRIMKWAKFQSAKSTVLTEPTPPVLMMEGQMFDNGFVDISAPNQANNDATIFQPHNDGADFVWLWRSGVRIGAIGYARLGHPGLAGGSPICCAGVLGRDEIFFHSGHYHPKEVNAKHYMYDLIEQSCITLLDGARDRKVKELCNLTLRFYVPGTTDRTYTTTFKAIINESLAGSTIDSAPEVGRGSSPMTIGSSTAFSPTPVDRRPSSVEDNAPLPPFVYPPARWQPDSSTSRCTKCDRAFTMFRRKHHCRNCGFIFCDACSSHKKDIRHRVARPGASSPETGEVRVCDDCVHLL